MRSRDSRVPPGEGRTFGESSGRFIATSSAECQGKRKKNVERPTSELERNRVWLPANLCGRLAKRTRNSPSCASDVHPRCPEEQPGNARACSSVQCSMFDVRRSTF